MKISGMKYWSQLDSQCREWSGDEAVTVVTVRCARHGAETKWRFRNEESDDSHHAEA